MVIFWKAIEQISSGAARCVVLLKSVRKSRQRSCYRPLHCYGTVPFLVKLFVHQPLHRSEAISCFLLHFEGLFKPAAFFTP